jgi:uncharacterized iron-regulated membrane protein
MTTRQFWLAVHRYTGLVVLVFVAIAAFTGCVLELRGPIDRALNPDLFYRTSNAAPLDPATAAAAYQARNPGAEVISFPLNPRAGETLPVTVAARAGAPPLAFDEVFLAANDGTAAGARSATKPGWDRRRLVEGIYLFHYTLLAGTPGRWFMGVCAAGWLIGAVVGLYLTFPSTGPFWKGWWRMFQLSLKGKLARVMLDLHQSTGLWLLIPVLVLAWTSVSMNFFDEAITPIAQAISPARPSPFDHPRAAPVVGPGVGFAAAIAKAETLAAKRGFAWKPASVAFNPQLGLYGVSFTNNGIVNYSRLGPVTYDLDAASGRFIYADDPYMDSAGRAVSRSLYPLHTGQVAGGWGMAFAFLLGAVTFIQCLTGVYVWWKRRGGRVAARKARRAARRRAAEAAP